MYQVPRNDEDEQFRIKVPRSNKPRAKALNEALMSHRACRINPKDVSRSKEKVKLRKMNFDEE